MNCRHCIPLSLGVITAVAVADVACSQSAGDEPFMAGEPLQQPANVRTYGNFRFAESIS